MNSMQILPAGIATSAPHETYPVLFHQNETRLDAIANNILKSRMSRHLPQNFEVSVEDVVHNFTGSAPVMAKKFTSYRSNLSIVCECVSAFFDELIDFNENLTYLDYTSTEASRQYEERRIIHVLLNNRINAIANNYALVNFYNTCRRIELLISFDGQSCKASIGAYPWHISLSRMTAVFILQVVSYALFLTAVEEVMLKVPGRLIPYKLRHLCQKIYVFVFICVFGKISHQKW